MVLIIYSKSSSFIEEKRSLHVENMRACIDPPESPIKSLKKS